MNGRSKPDMLSVIAAYWPSRQPCAERQIERENRLRAVPAWPGTNARRVAAQHPRERTADAVHAPRPAGRRQSIDVESGLVVHFLHGSCPGRRTTILNMGILLLSRAIANALHDDVAVRPLKR